jgi:hypothetical protein
MRKKIYCFLLIIPIFIGLSSSASAQIVVENASFILFNRAISPELPAPDLDGDGDVDGSDLSVFADAYAIGDSLADLNNDGNVDTEDLATFAADFGRTNCPQGLDRVVSVH